jgi:hypothetical protein
MALYNPSSSALIWKGEINGTALCVTSHYSFVCLFSYLISNLLLSRKKIIWLTCSQSKFPHWEQTLYGVTWNSTWKKILNCIHVYGYIILGFILLFQKKKTNVRMRDGRGPHFTASDSIIFILIPLLPQVHLLHTTTIWHVLSSAYEVADLLRLLFWICMPQLRMKVLI